MTLMKWSPFEEAEMLRKQIDTIFSPISPLSDETGVGLNPPVDVVEAENAYKARLMLPGLPAESIGEHVRIDATTKTLTVSGELRQKELASGEKMLIHQCRTGKFFKQLSFPDGIDPDGIEASYADGILEIVLPKAAAAQKRSIQINTQRK